MVSSHLPFFEPKAIHELVSMSSSQHSHYSITELTVLNFNCLCVFTYENLSFWSYSFFYVSVYHSVLHKASFKKGILNEFINGWMDGWISTGPLKMLLEATSGWSLRTFQLLLCPSDESCNIIRFTFLIYKMKAMPPISLGCCEAQNKYFMLGAYPWTRHCSLFSLSTFSLSSTRRRWPGLHWGSSHAVCNVVKW